MKRDRYALPDSALDINLPDRRAKRCTPPRAAKEPKATAYSASQSDREAWMREKQEKARRNAAMEREAIKRANLRPDRENAAEYFQQQKENERMAPIEGKREAQLLAEAEAEIRRRRLLENLRG